MATQDKVSFVSLGPESSERLKTRLFVFYLKRIYNQIEDGKIKYFVGTCNEFFCFTKLYEELVEIGGADLEISEQEKKSIWKEVKKSAARTMKILSRNDKELYEKLCLKYYKSELIYKYIVDMYNNKGVVFGLYHNHKNILYEPK